MFGSSRGRGWLEDGLSLHSLGGLNGEGAEWNVVCESTINSLYAIYTKGKARGKDKGKNKGKSNECFKCGQPGHIAINCPKGKGKGQNYNQYQPYTPKGKNKGGYQYNNPKGSRKTGFPKGLKGENNPSNAFGVGDLDILPDYVEINQDKYPCK